MSKSILQIIYSCSVNKTARKNTKYSRNDSILKIGNHAKAIAHDKILTLGQKLKFHTTCQNPFYKYFTVVLCRKPLEKKTNIREMRAFSKSALMQRLYAMQSPDFRSKVKIPKRMLKSILKIIYSCSLQKTARKKHQIFEK